jgi:outer membrane protein TolC
MPAMVGLAQSPQTGKQFLPPPSIPEAPTELNPLDPVARIHAGKSAERQDAPDVKHDVPGNEYSLTDVLSLAAANNPTIRQARLQISAQTAKALQAGLYPNPLLRYTGEQVGVDVDGDKDSPGEFQGMILSQRFVTAGKLRLSREKYMFRAHISEHLAIAQQFRVCNDVRVHFYRTLAASRIVLLRRELLKTLEDSAVTSRELYNAGQAMRADVRRSSITLQRARLELLQDENRYRDLHRQLSALVGVDLSNGYVSGQLMPEQPPASYQESLAKLLSESPELLAARAKLAADRVTLRREQVEWVPDIVAEGGAGYNFDAKETTAVVGVAIELPVYDRNQGTIRQAQLDLYQQHQEIRRTELDLKRRLATTYQNYLTALQMANEYDRFIVPEAKLLYEELLQSYKVNRIDWPEVLLAQQDYANARLTQIQNLESVRTNEVLIRGFLLHGGLMAAPGPTPPGHIDAVPKPR